MANVENQELISDCWFNPLSLGTVCYITQMNRCSDSTALSDRNLMAEQPLCISLDSMAESFIIWLTGDIKVPSFSKGTSATLITGLFYISNFHT